MQCRGQVSREAWAMRKSKWKTLNETLTFRSFLLVSPEIYYWALASLNLTPSQGQGT